MAFIVDRMANRALPKPSSRGILACVLLLRLRPQKILTAGAAGI